LLGHLTQGESIDYQASEAMRAAGISMDAEDAQSDDDDDSDESDGDGDDDDDDDDGDVCWGEVSFRCFNAETP
jgi:hypothetical protein